VMNVHAKLNITPYLSLIVDEKVTTALNLWDIEMRIQSLHRELDALHEMKDGLLETNVPVKCN